MHTCWRCWASLHRWFTLRQQGPVSNAVGWERRYVTYSTQNWHEFYSVTSGNSLTHVLWPFISHSRLCGKGELSHSGCQCQESWGSWCPAETHVLPSSTPGHPAIPLIPMPSDQKQWAKASQTPQERSLLQRNTGCEIRCTSRPTGGKETPSSCLGALDCLLEGRLKGPVKWQWHQSRDDTTSEKTCRHQVTMWLCCKLLSFPNILPAPHWSNRNRAKLGFSQGCPPWDKMFPDLTWAGSPFVQDWKVNWILLSGTQAARQVSHTPTVCALALSALSCPAEQSVPAPTQTLPQPPPGVISLTWCQKLCQLKHNSETSLHVKSLSPHSRRKAGLGGGEQAGRKTDTIKNYFNF